MPLHFTPSEFAARRSRLCAALAERGLDGLLLFSQNSMYWLTGWDSFSSSAFTSAPRAAPRS